MVKLKKPKGKSSKPTSKELVKIESIPDTVSKLPKSKPIKRNDPEARTIVDIIADTRSGVPIPA